MALEEIIWDEVTNNKIVPRDKGVVLRSFSLKEDEKKKLIITDNNVDSIMSLLHEIIDAHSLRVNVTRKVLGGDSSVGAIEVIRILLDRFISDFKVAIDEYKEAATQIWEEDNLTPELFVDKILRY